MLCNTSPLCKDGDDYIEDDDDVGDGEDDNDADNCDHSVVTIIMVAIMMVTMMMVKIMMVTIVEMMTATRIMMMTMNNLSKSSSNLEISLNPMQNFNLTEEGRRQR